MTQNAFMAGYNAPQVQSFGLDVDDDICRLIACHGAEKVKAAVRKMTAKKKGRRKSDLETVLRPILMKDAERWLNGVKKYKTSANTSIAKACADLADPRSILRRLAKERVPRTALYAYIFSIEKWPEIDHLRATHWLGSVSPDWKEACAINAAEIEAQIALHEAKIGPVPANLTKRELLQVATQIKYREMFAHKTPDTLTPARAFSRILVDRI